ncbi:MAG: TIGR04283 family arsenosugar biosynthesis glycosyltransferase [Betaproteobacteria bacterium]
MATLSIVVPTLNEAAGIVEHLVALQGLRRGGTEVIVVDGGSTDGTPALAAPWADAIVSGIPGRAVQMNLGASHAGGSLLLFLHADTRLPESADSLIAEGLADEGRTWGRFDVTIEAAHPLLRVVAWSMNWRSRLTGIATGDQAIFARRSAFEQAGGFPELPLMEDIALSRSLKRIGHPLCLRERVTTSGRRWEQHGVLRTIMLMWRLRAGYWLGVDPGRLATAYASGRRVR